MRTWVAASAAATLAVLALMVAFTAAGTPAGDTVAAQLADPRDDSGLFRRGFFLALIYLTNPPCSVHVTYQVRRVVMSVLDSEFFKSDEAAREHLEGLRWPHGPVCPHCGAVENIKKLEESPKHRPGLYKCYVCKGQFTVTVGTLFERSKVPLRKWFLAVYFPCSSKKGMSSTNCIGRSA